MPPVYPSLLLCLFASASLAQPKPAQSFSLTGQTTRPLNGKGYLFNAAEQLIDSTVISQNQFVFRGKLAEPGLYTIQLDTATRQYPVFLEAPPMQILFMGDTYLVTGSALHTQWKQYDDYNNSLLNKLGDLHQARRVAEQKGDTALLSQLWRENTVVSLALGNGVNRLLRQKPYTFLNVFVLKNFGVGDSVTESVLNDFRSQLGHYPTFKTIERGLKERAAREQHAVTSKKAVLFTFPDRKNRMVSLNDMLTSKKLVLVDFWASWCGPCIKGLPDLKKLHSQYADQGLEIVGVSIDSDSEQWHKALDSYTPAGVQLLAGETSSVKAKYAVFSIPQTFLIDQQGTIRERNLRGEALTKRIAQLLQEKP